MPPTVRVFGHVRDGPTANLFLEHAARRSNWPWSDVATAVCRALARYHDCRVLPNETFGWDYDRELSSSALETLALAKNACDSTGRSYWRRLGDLKRVVTALPHIRERLLSSESSLIHEFCREFAKEMNRLRMEQGASITSAKRELARIEARRKKLIDLVLDDQLPASAAKAELLANN